MDPPEGAIAELCDAERYISKIEHFADISDVFHFLNKTCILIKEKSFKSVSGYPIDKTSLLVKGKGWYRAVDKP